MSLEIVTFPALESNYGFVVRDEASGMTAAIDAPDFASVDQALTARNWKLDFILITHHHPDHTDGIVPLKEKYACEVIAPQKCADKIPAVDRTITDADQVRVGETSFQVIDISGHTLDHIGFYSPSDQAAFVADVIFPMGCGKIFEGTAEQGWRAVERINALPPETRLYCAHEITLGNADFALTILPGHEGITQRRKAVERLLDEGGMTVPTTLAQERETNIFLFPADPAFGSAIGMEGASPADLFAHLRAKKDDFWAPEPAPPS